MTIKRLPACERLSDPGSGPYSSTLLQHLARYLFAANFVKNCEVVNAACGTGYGTCILARVGNCRRIIGLDIDPEAVAQAKTICASPKATFEVCDLVNRRAAQVYGEFDIFVSFETVEHVPDTSAYFSTVTSMLRRGGTLIISTPNRVVNDPGVGRSEKPSNPYHVFEWDFQELNQNLRQHFQSVDYYAQERPSKALSLFLIQTMVAFPYKSS